MSAFSKFLYSGPMRRNAIILASSMVCIYWSSLRIIQLRNKDLAKKQKYDNTIDSSKKSDKKDKVAVDKKFFRKLNKLFQILVPNWHCAEVGFAVLVAFSLICRTFADVFLITNGTAIERSIITSNRKDFIQNLAKYVMSMPIISIINNSLKYGLDELKLRFRTRMTKHLYSKYLKDLTYYKMNNLDNRITNVDQLLTQDVEKFCNSLTDLYSNISKPFLDVVIYATKLANAIGVQGPALMLSYLVLSSLFLTILRKPIAQMTIKEQQNEGEFRYMNSRLITNSEEVAFYRGHKREEINIMNSFCRLENQIRNSIIFRFSTGFIDNIVAKYFATFIGFNVVSVPFFTPNSRITHLTPSERLEDYYRTGRMLVKLAEALGRLSLAGRELTRLAGFTERVTQLMVVINDLHNGHYERTMVNKNNNDEKKNKRIQKFHRLENLKTERRQNNLQRQHN